MSAVRPVRMRLAAPTPDQVLERIYAEHHDAVWRCLRALGVPYDQLDDATQDVFVVVHRRLAGFDHAAPVGAWILGISRNIARKYRSIRASAPLLGVIDRDRAASPEEVVETRRAAEVVQHFLEALPLEQREVFVLMEIHGLSAPEISTQLQVPLNTIYSRLRLARRRFDRTLERERARVRRAP